MQRALDLARLGAGKVSPNPMVGAVIVKDEQIIGEGYHKKYRAAHAEVNAVKSLGNDINLDDLRHSKLYVSLEPCNFYGNTPPCTELIIKNQIPQIYVSAIDQTAQVAGNGIAQLENNGCLVNTGILQKAGERLGIIRNTFVRKRRPFIILKYAQSSDGFIGKSEGQVQISNSFSQRLVHKWRSELDAILVGTNTAAIDNPILNVRFGWGGSPLRLVLDKQLRLPNDLNLYNDQHETRIFTHQTIPKHDFKKTRFWTLNSEQDVIIQMMEKLFDEQVSSLLVEGGRQLIQSFIDLNLWDEARIFTSPVTLRSGYPAPNFPSIEPELSRTILGDQLSVYFNKIS